MLFVPFFDPNMKEKGSETLERCSEGGRSLWGSWAQGKAFGFRGIRAGHLPLLEHCFSLPATANILIAGAKAIADFITCNPILKLISDPSAAAGCCHQPGWHWAQPHAPEHILFLLKQTGMGWLCFRPSLCAQRWHLGLLRWQCPLCVLGKAGWQI